MIFHKVLSFHAAVVLVFVLVFIVLFRMPQAWLCYGVEEFMVEKFGVEKFGFEAWG